MAGGRGVRTGGGCHGREGCWASRHLTKSLRADQMTSLLRTLQPCWNNSCLQENMGEEEERHMEKGN